MDRALPPNRIAESLERLRRDWAEKQNAARQTNGLSPQPHLWTIAISREAGTQGAAVGHAVGTRLGWPVYDHEILKWIAHDTGLRTELLESVEERRVSWLKEVFESLLAVPFMSEPAYVHRLVKAVFALGSHGECVIVGRGAALILPAETTLRVRLIAPRNDRIRVLNRRLGISEEAAAQELERLDRERRAFVRDHFFRDPNDPCHYDLLLNSARFGVVGCAKLIIEALDCLKAGMIRNSSETAQTR
jgi:cytidylate kinase